MTWDALPGRASIRRPGFQALPHLVGPDPASRSSPRTPGQDPIPLMLTRSSPRVDSLSSRGSPGAWIVTDLSPRLPSRLLERCRSRRSLQQVARGRGTDGQRGPGSSQQPVRMPTPPAPSSAPRLPTCACGSCGSGPTCRSSPSTGTRCPWRPNAAPCSAPGPRAGAFWGAPQPPPSPPASSGQGAPSGNQPSP